MSDEAFRVGGTLTPHSESQLMQTIDDLACAIDIASDADDETMLRQLGEDCENRLGTAEGEDRVLLLYYKSNTYSAINASEQHDADYI